eukprot:scaffold662_cov142-Isochrysis_galbana.AAC.1
MNFQIIIASARVPIPALGKAKRIAVGSCMLTWSILSRLEKISIMTGQVPKWNVRSFALLQSLQRGPCAAL